MPRIPARPPVLPCLPPAHLPVLVHARPPVLVLYRLPVSIPCSSPSPPSLLVPLSSSMLVPCPPLPSSLPVFLRWLPPTSSARMPSLSLWDPFHSRGGQKQFVKLWLLLFFCRYLEILKKKNSQLQWDAASREHFVKSEWVIFVFLTLWLPSKD